MSLPLLYSSVNTVAHDTREEAHLLLRNFDKPFYFDALVVVVVTIYYTCRKRLGGGGEKEMFDRSRKAAHSFRVIYCELSFCSSSFLA